MTRITIHANANARATMNSDQTMTTTSLETCDCCGEEQPTREMAITPGGQFLCRKCMSDVTTKLVMKSEKCKKCGSDTAPAIQPCFQCQADCYQGDGTVVVALVVMVAAAILLVAVTCFGFRIFTQ